MPWVDPLGARVDALEKTVSGFVARLGRTYVTDAGRELMAADTASAQVTLLSGVATNTPALYTAGSSSVAHDLGTISSGTVTPSADDGNLQYYVNNGAHVLAVPTPVTGGDALRMIIQVTNSASAGAITTSAFTWVTGDTLTTTSGDDFMLEIALINGFSRLNVVALQ